MARVVAKCIFFFLSLTVCCSGTLVGFSYDAKKNSGTSSSIETISFLKKNKVSPSQIRVSVADSRILNSLSHTGIAVDLYVNGTLIENLQKSKASVLSWLRNHLITFTPHVNVSSILINRQSISHNQLHLLLPTLNSIHLALKSVNLDQQVKVAVEFPLSMLENSDKYYDKYLQKIAGFVRKCKSFIVIEAVVDGELSLGDQFVQSMIEKATFAATVIPYRDISMVLKVKSSAAPSAAEVAEFTEKVMKSLGNHAQISNQIYGLFVDLSSMEENKQKELHREVEQIFPSSHRELLNNDRPISAVTRTTIHDSVTSPTTVLPTAPVTNPVTTPVTDPSTNPTPTIVTVPSTNPVTILPTNPVTTPISNPATTPVTVPVTTPVITVPSTYPVTPPAAVPVTNPVTTPIGVPTTPPVTNPVTTYPPGGTSPTTPSTTPVIFPMPPPATSSPVVSGQSWCVAKMGISDAALQNALDYACGIGGADCSVIQSTGSCYNPNTLHDHASYAFNSYYQKNPMPSSCDFGGTAMLVNTNPSSGSCIYASSSSSSSPSTTSSSSPSTTSSSSPSSVLNTYPANSTTVFAPEPPEGISSSVSVQVNSQMLLALVSLTVSLIIGKHLLQE